MFNKKRKRSSDEHTDYWLSYSDLMAGLLMAFMLIVFVAALNYNSSKDVIKAQEKQIEELIGIKTKIIENLILEFEDSDMNVEIDKQTGDIRLESGVFFDSDRYTLKSSGKEFLNRFIPFYLSVLLSEENSEFISEIIIEGHTDSDASYIYNLELSQKRAFEVTKYIMTHDFDTIDGELKEVLRNIITANGKSFTELIYDESGKVDMEKSRRVEFKFRIKDDEMIQEMIRIMGDN